MALSKNTIGDFIKKINLNNPQGFRGKLYDATRHGELQNFGDNREALEQVLKKRATQIKRGEYDTGRRQGDYREMLKSGKLTQEDQKEVKSLLNAFGDKSFQKPEMSAPKANNAPLAKSRPWRPWEKMPSFLTDRFSPGAKNKPYSAGNRLGISGNRSSNLSSTQGGASLSPSASSSNPPRLIK